MERNFAYIIKPNDGRRFVIGDIHGCNQTLQELIWDKIKLTHKDQLFFLGDFVDRGPDSKGVLDTIRQLKKQEYIIFPLRGNHENTLLEYNREELRFFEWYLKKNNQMDLMKNGKLKNKYKKLIKKLPYYYILDHFYLVHAGFDIQNPKPFENYTAMTELRNMKYDEKLFEGKKIIFGHQPTPLTKIQQSIIQNWPLICLDNGAVYKNKNKRFIDTSELGNLVALNLDQMQLMVQPNIDL
jgi:serine/threonine protein phosphatase 1